MEHEVRGSNRSNQIKDCLALAAVMHGGAPRISSKWCRLLNEIRHESIVAIDPRGLGQVLATARRNGETLVDGMQIRRVGHSAPYAWEVLDAEGRSIPAPGEEGLTEPEPTQAGPTHIEGITSVCSQEHSIYLDGTALVRALQALGYSIPKDSAMVSAVGTGDQVILHDALQIRVQWITLAPA